MLFIVTLNLLFSCDFHLPRADRYLSRLYLEKYMFLQNGSDLSSNCKCCSRFDRERESSYSAVYSKIQYLRKMSKLCLFFSRRLCRDEMDKQYFNFSQQRVLLVIILSTVTTLFAVLCKQLFSAIFGYVIVIHVG